MEKKLEKIENLSNHNKLYRKHNKYHLNLSHSLNATIADIDLSYMNG